MERKWLCVAESTLLLAVCTLFGSCGTRLHTADLLFHVAPTGNAITDVTPGMIDHVSIVVSADSVIEAIGQGVSLTPIDSVLQREGSHLVGRVRGISRKQSVATARQYLGRRYDHLYLPDNADIYCSELVQFSYVDRHGRQVMQPIAMSFHDATGRITPYWQSFYARHGMEVPEGKPGTNPGEMSERDNVKIIGNIHRLERRSNTLTQPKHGQRKRYRIERTNASRNRR